MTAQMCIQLPRWTLVGIWIVILFPQLIAMSEHLSEYTMQPSHDFSSISDLTSSSSQDSTLLQSTIQYSTSTFSETLSSAIISPSRTLQTIQGNSIVTSGTHVLTSSITTLDNHYTSHTTRSPSFSNQNTEPSISSLDTTVEYNSLDTNIVSATALDMTVLNTTLALSSLVTSFNELSMSSVLNLGSESQSSSDFINDNKLTETYTLSTILTDSVISKSVIEHIKSTRTLTYTSAETLDTDSSWMVHSSSLLSPTPSLPDSSLMRSLSSEVNNEITSETSVVLNSNTLDSSPSNGLNVPSSPSAGLNVPVNSTPSRVSSVLNIGQTGKSHYDIDSRMSGMITSHSDTYSALTSSTSTISVTDQLSVYTTSGPSHEDTVSIVSEMNIPSDSSFLYASELHSLSEDIASKRSFYQQVSMTLHGSIISPTSITNAIYDSMQTVSPSFNELKVNSEITSIINSSLATPKTVSKASSLERLSTNFNSLTNTMDAFSPPSKSHLDTGIMISSSIDVLSHSASTGLPDTFQRFSTSQLHTFSEGQDQPDMSTVRFTADRFDSSTALSSEVPSLSKHRTTVLTISSSIYSTTTSTSYTTESTREKVEMSTLLSESSLSEILAVSSFSDWTVEKSTQTNETQFATVVSTQVFGFDVTTFSTVHSGLDSTQGQTPETIASSLYKSPESNISPTTTSHFISILDNVNSISQNAESSSSVVEDSDRHYSSSYDFQTTVAEVTVTSSGTIIGQTKIIETYSKIESPSAFYRSLSLSANDALSLTSTTDSLISNIISSDSTAETVVTPPLHTGSLYSEIMNSVSTASKQSQTSMLMELSKLQSNITESSVYVDTTVPLSTTSDLKSLYSINSISSENATGLSDSQTDASYTSTVTILTPDSFASINSTQTKHSSESSLFELKSSDLLPSFKSVSSDELTLLSRTFTPMLVTSELQTNIDISSVPNLSRTSLVHVLSTLYTSSGVGYTNSISQNITESHIKISSNNTRIAVDQSSNVNVTAYSLSSFIESLDSIELFKSSENASIHLSTSIKLDISDTTSSKVEIESTSLTKAIHISRSISDSNSNTGEQGMSSNVRVSDLQVSTTVDYQSISTSQTVPPIVSSNGWITYEEASTALVLTPHLDQSIISASGTSDTDTVSYARTSTFLSDSFGLVTITDGQVIASTSDGTSHPLQSDNLIHSPTNLYSSESDTSSEISNVSNNILLSSTIIGTASIELGQVSSKRASSFLSSSGYAFSAMTDSISIPSNTLLSSQPINTASPLESTDVISNKPKPTLSSKLDDTKYSFIASPTDSTDFVSKTQIHTSVSEFTNSQHIITTTPTDSAGFVSNNPTSTPPSELTNGPYIITASPSDSTGFDSIKPNSTSDSELTTSNHSSTMSPSDSTYVVPNTPIQTPSSELTNSQHIITASPTDSTGVISTAFISTQSNNIKDSQHIITASPTDSTGLSTNKPNSTSDSKITNSKYIITASLTYTSEFVSNASTPSSEFSNSQQSIIASPTDLSDVISNTSIQTPSSELTSIHGFITNSPIELSTMSLQTLASELTISQRSITSWPTDIMVIVSTSTFTTHLDNASSLTLLSNSSMHLTMSSIPVGIHESSGVTETLWFTKSTVEVAVGTESQQKSPITHDSSVIFNSQSSSTIFNDIFTSAGSSLKSEDSLAYTSTPSVEVLKTLSPSSTLVTTDISTHMPVDSNMVTDTSALSELSDSMSMFPSLNSFASTRSSIIETMVTSFDTMKQLDTISVLNTETLSNLSSTNVDGSFSIDVTDSQSPAYSLSVSQHSGIVYSTLSPTQLEVSPSIVTTPPYSPVLSIIQSSPVVTTPDAYSTVITNSSVEQNATTPINVATDTVFDTTIIGTISASFNSVDLSMEHSSISDTGKPESQVASMLLSLISNYSSTIFPSSTLNDSILTTISMFDYSESVSSVISQDVVIHTSFDTDKTNLLDSTVSLSTLFPSSKHLLSSFVALSSTIDALITTTSRENSMLFPTDVSSLSNMLSFVSTTTDELTISDKASSKITLNTVSTSDSFEFLETLSSVSHQTVMSINSTHILASSSSSQSMSFSESAKTTPLSISSRQMITSESVSFSESVKPSTLPVASTSFGFQVSSEIISLFSPSDYTSYLTHSSVATTEAFSSVLVSSKELQVSPSGALSAVTSDDIMPFSSDFVTGSSSHLNGSKFSIVQSSPIVYSSSITTTQFELSSSESLITTVLSSVISPTLTVASHSLESTADRPGSESLLLSTSTVSPTYDSEFMTDQTIVTPSHAPPESFVLSTPTVLPTYDSKFMTDHSTVTPSDSPPESVVLSTPTVSPTYDSESITDQQTVTPYNSPPESFVLSTPTVSPTYDSELMTDQLTVSPSNSPPESLSLSTPTVSQSFTEYSVTSLVVEPSAQSSSYFNSILSSSRVVTPTSLSTGLTSLESKSLHATSKYLETQVSVLSASTITSVLLSTEVQESHSPSIASASTDLTTWISIIITSSIAPVTSLESITYSTLLLETISPTSASVFMTNDSMNSTMLSTALPDSINSTDGLQTQNVSAGNQTSAIFSITVTSSSIMDTVSVSSSVFNPTTEQPVTTTRNITNVEESFWIRTVLKIQRGTNTTSAAFIKELERRLAEAYNEAFVREKLIKEGKFEPLQRRRRKKRFATSGEASVHIHELSRHKDSSTVTVIYAVEKSGEVMTSREAVTALQVLDDQELAIILRQVVAVKAETYSQTSEPEVPTTDENFPLWMIGAIAGGAAAVGILIWIVVCIYCKCCKKKERYEQTEPELTSILPEHSKRKESKTRPLSQSPVKKPLEYQRQTSHTSLKKASNYTIPEPHREAVEVIDERRLIETPVKREPVKPAQPAPPSSPECSTTVTPVLPRRELIVPPAVKKGGRRNSKNSIGPSIEELELRRGSILSKERKFDVSQMFQSTVSEDSDSVKELIRAEKKKNKELLRDKYGQDMDLPVDTERSYDDREKIMLDMPNTSVPSFVIATGSPTKKKPSTQRRHSEGNTLDDGNLEKAKNRMHQLLDDAFSLITPIEHESYVENDSRLRKDEPRKREHTNLLHSSEEPRLPFSGYTNPGYTHSSEYFEAWSPYRSSDQVALISMPHTLVSSVTKLGAKSDKRATASKTGKRPASNLDIVNTKTTAQPTENKKSPSVHSMTRDPPEPIRLRTKDANSSDRLLSPKPRTTKPEHQTNNGKPKSSSLGSGIILNGSVTSLSKLSHTDLSHSKNESVEMKPLNRNGWGKIRDKNIQDKDKRDANNRTDNLFQSLRNELNTLTNPEAEDDINKKPIRRKNRKVNKPMTDIM